MRTAKLHSDSGSCSDRTGGHWQNDGDRTTIGEVQGAELWQGRERGMLKEQPGNWQFRGGSGLRKLSAQSFLEVCAVLSSL